MVNEGDYAPPHSGEDTYYLYKILVRATLRRNWAYDHGHQQHYNAARATISAVASRTYDFLYANWLSLYTSRPSSLPLPAADLRAKSVASQRLTSIRVRAELDADRIERAKELLAR